ncbi:glycosyltransferase family 2 protein [Methylophaga sp.]|uniref:glycosyltransferase family 2 protein n=1 Tax=Methylophaga sp. TaxID=2024840 RepID=UPI003A911296
MLGFSVVIPAKNESATIGRLVSQILENTTCSEVIVVDDGSSDSTAEIALEAGARVLAHPYPKGNGAAIKTGARGASMDVLIFMDADGQHDPRDIPVLIEKIESGYDLVVGARGAVSQASLGRRLANGFYNKLASYMTGHRVADLTSGFRAVRKDKFIEFLHLLPNGFSYPTTSTMAFFRAGYSVCYVPILVHARKGESHIRPVQDGIRFLLIIFKIGTLYSPLKLFFPLAVSIFSTGLGYYIYTYLTASRFTNMSALMFTTALTIFMVGLVSEQITSLMYSGRTHSDSRRQK